MSFIFHIKEKQIKEKSLPLGRDTPDARCGWKTERHGEWEVTWVQWEVTWADSERWKDAAVPEDNDKR